METCIPEILIIYLCAVDSFAQRTVKRNFPFDVDNKMKRHKVDAGKKCSGVILTPLRWLELHITILVE